MQCLDDATAIHNFLSPVKTETSDSINQFNPPVRAVERCRRGVGAREGIKQTSCSSPRAGSPAVQLCQYLPVRRDQKQTLKRITNDSLPLVCLPPLCRWLKEEYKDRRGEEKKWSSAGGKLKV